MFVGQDFFIFQIPKNCCLFTQQMQEVKDKFSINQYLKQWILPLSLVVCIVVVKLFPSFLEAYYSNGVYQNISKVVRKVTGWISISLGDVFYGIVLIRVFFLFG